MVDLWSEDREERTHVLNHTPREKAQGDRKRQATHGSRAKLVIYRLPSAGGAENNCFSRPLAQVPMHLQQLMIQLPTVVYSLPEKPPPALVGVAAPLYMPAVIALPPKGQAQEPLHLNNKIRFRRPSGVRQGLQCTLYHL